MRFRILSIVAIVVLLPLITSSSGSVRKAEDLIRKHVNAVGGKAAIKAIGGLQIDGTIETQGFTFPMALYVKRPLKTRMELDFQGQQIIQVYNGDIAWWMNPFAGASVAQQMPQDFAAAIIKWADFNGPLYNYRDKKHRVRYAGMAELANGIEAYDIEVDHANDETWHVYLDPESYLEVARRFPQTFMGDTEEIMAYMSDFEEVGGVTSARVIESIGLTGAPFTMRFDRVEIDNDVSDDIFELPEPDEESRAQDEGYIEIDALSDLADAFNDGHGDVRALAILSPT